MALPKTLTAANSKFTLVVAGIALGPVTLEGYSTDSSFAADAVDTAEVVMGVDGKMSGGYMPNPTPINITLQADSPSIQVFDDWITAQRAVKEIFPCSGNISVPSVQKSYVMTNGILTRITPLAPGGKILGPQAYTITCENLQPVPLVL